MVYHGSGIRNRILIKRHKHKATQFVLLPTFKRLYPLHFAEQMKGIINCYYVRVAVVAMAIEL